MMKLLENMPAGVLGVEGSGTVTHEDYRDVLIPAAEKLLQKGSVKMLYVLGADFKGYALGALWDDTAFGLRNWKQFSHIAFVSDHEWLKGAVSMFTPFFPGEVKLFSLAERDKAAEWIAQAKPNSGKAA